MPQNKIEKRVVANKLEARDLRDEGKGLTIGGLAVPFASNSQVLKENGKVFIEEINPQAFDKFLSEQNDIMLLYSHDWDSPLARLAAGTLRVWKEADGIYFEATLTDTTRALDLIKDIRAGNIYGLSFGFVLLRDKWTRGADNVLHCEILEGKLLEISPVVNPAYKATKVESRSLKEFLELEGRTNTSDDFRKAKYRFLKNKQSKKG